MSSLNSKIEKMQEDGERIKILDIYLHPKIKLKLIIKYLQVQYFQNQVIFKLIRISSQKKDSSLYWNFSETQKSLNLLEWKLIK